MLLYYIIFIKGWQFGSWNRRMHFVFLLRPMETNGTTSPIRQSVKHFVNITQIVSEFPTHMVQSIHMYAMCVYATYVIHAFINLCFKLMLSLSYAFLCDVWLIQITQTLIELFILCLAYVINLPILFWSNLLTFNLFFFYCLFMAPTTITMFMIIK